MNNRVVLIDFGIAEKYWDEDGSHKTILRLGYLGTPFYSSVKAHQGYSQGRRDDLSSIGFSILQIINPEISMVPWATLKSDNLRGFLREKCIFLKIDGGDDYFMP
jgi:serine/threonine protein kinase